MRSIKSSVFVLTVLSAFLLFIAIMPLAKGRSTKAAPTDPQSVTATFTNVAGQTFGPNQIVKLKWTLQGDGVKALEDDPWSECELMFSPDGGNTWNRISPELSVRRRDFDWVVPNLPTKQALVQLRIGTQGANDFYFFPSPTFVITAPWIHGQ
jgi:hypothetical protein